MRRVCLLVVLLLSFDLFSINNNWSVSAEEIINPNLEYISCGDAFKVAVKYDGSVWVWGQNTYGQLGNGTYTNSQKPTPVHGLNDVISVSCGDSHVLALKKDGTVWSWGLNSRGQLGDGTTTKRNIPEQIQGLTDIVLISSAGTYSLALSKDGTVWEWGGMELSEYYNNKLVFNPAEAWRTTPRKKNLLHKSVAIVAGKQESILLTDKGELYVYDSENSQLIDNIKGIKLVTKGFEHTAILKDDGTVWSWGGYNVYGQIGNGETQYYETIYKETNVEETVGYIYVPDGNNSYFVIPIVSEREYFVADYPDIVSEPQLVNIITDIKKVVAAGFGSIGLKEDGTVWGWGQNDYGLIDLKNVAKIDNPTKLDVLENIVNIDMGKNNYVAVKDDGSVWEWGSTRVEGGNYICTSTPTQIEDFYLFETSSENDSDESTEDTSIEIKLKINDPKMTVNDEIQEIDPGRGTAPIIANDRTILPIRSIVEILGGTVDWDGKEQKITIAIETKAIELWIGKKKIVINGEERQLDTEPMIINGRTMLPLRYVVENIGCNVIWNDKDKEIIIYKKLQLTPY